MTRTQFNFIRGMGSVLELLPPPVPSNVGQGIDIGRSDVDAIQQDWQRMTDDFKAAFEKTSEEVGERVKSK